jgi:putative transposase
MAFMPWKKSEPMEQRIEFALKAMRTLNFRALCQEYGISAKTGYKWKERFVREELSGMEEESRRPKAMLINCRRQRCVKLCA